MSKQVRRLLILRNEVHSYNRSFLIKCLRTFPDHNSRDLLRKLKLSELNVLVEDVPGTIIAHVYALSRRVGTAKLNNCLDKATIHE